MYSKLLKAVFLTCALVGVICAYSFVSNDEPEKFPPPRPERYAISSVPAPMAPAPLPAVRPREPDSPQTQQAPAPQQSADNPPGRDHVYLPPGYVKKTYTNATPKEMAEKGNTRAQFDLGLIFTAGYFIVNGIQVGDEDTKQDVEESMKWLRLAADHGNGEAATRLGNHYEYEWGGLKHDYTEALNWYRKAAENGDAKGMMHIGEMYAKGHGMEKDYAEAYYWEEIAAVYGGVHDMRGDTLDPDEIDQIPRTHLTPEQIAAEDKRVKQWSPTNLLDIQKRAEANDAASQYWLAQIKIKGKSKGSE